MLSRNKGFSSVKEPIERINWKISNEKKNLETFECTKEIGTIRGREYTAWFIKSIPLAYGLWKLQGSPSLILEACFYFKSVKYAVDKTTKIDVLNPDNENRKWITNEEYKVLLSNLHHRNIQNGRMIAETYDGTTTVENKMQMRNLFI